MHEYIIRITKMVFVSHASQRKILTTPTIPYRRQKYGFIGNILLNSKYPPSIQVIQKKREYINLNQAMMSTD